MKRKSKKKSYRGMWITIGILIVIWVGACFGSEIRLKTETEVLQSEISTLSKLSIKQENDIKNLKQQLDLSNAKLDAYKLSPKAGIVVKNQPEIAKKIKEYFGEDWIEATELISRESGLNPQAVNPITGACGLFQAYRCEKMNCSLIDIDCQLNWGRKYILNRYGDAKKALAFHNLYHYY